MFCTEQIDNPRRNAVRLSLRAIDICFLDCTKRKAIKA
jgi:hypothetical protein